MKYTGDADDDNVGCIASRKRFKHEPLSPTMFHSEDEQSSLSDDSDDDEDTPLAPSRILTDLDAAGLQEADPTEVVSLVKPKLEMRDDDATTTITNHERDAAICRIQNRVKSEPSEDDQERATGVSSPDACLTSLTSPLDTSQAIDSHPMTPPYTDRYTTQGNHDHLDGNRYHHSQPYRRPSISRNRRDEIRLNEHQQEHLDQILTAIREGDFDKFSELLGKKRDCMKNLLNVFVKGRTALHWSLLYGRSLAWSRQLVMNGANPNLANKDGWFPIHLAAHSGCTKTLIYLLEHTAEW